VPVDLPVSFCMCFDKCSYCMLVHDWSEDDGGGAIARLVYVCIVWRGIDLAVSTGSNRPAALATARAMHALAP
jgi:hypothetical protein